MSGQKVVREERGLHHAIIWYAPPGEAPPSGLRPERVIRSGDGRMTLPRVALVVPSWARPCGVAEYARHLMWGLRMQGVTVEVGDGLGEDDGVPGGLGTRVVHFQHEYSLWEPERLRRQALASLRAGAATVVTVHCLDRLPEHNRVLQTCFRRVIVHTEGMRAEALRAGFPPNLLEVIPMGVRRAHLPDRAAARAELGLGEEPAVGFFGFFYPQKGIIELLQAVRELRRERPGLRCFLFASAAPNPASRSYREEVLRALGRDGLGEGVTLIDQYLSLDRLVRHLHAMDVNVLPYSDLPGRQVSAAVRTAMAAERPIVTTAAFPFADLDGEVCKVGAPVPSEIAAAVRRVLDDERLQRELVRRVRRYAEENDWLRVAARHIALYRSL